MVPGPACRLLVVLSELLLVAAFRTGRRLGGPSAAQQPVQRPMVTRLSHADELARPPKLAALQMSSAALFSRRLPGTEVSSRQMDALLKGRLTPPAVHPGGTAFGFADESDRPRGVLGLSDAYGTEYVGLVGVGTKRTAGGEVEPEAVLRVVYDTGSSEFWVASDLCKSGPCARKSRQRFNHSRSETFQDSQESEPITTIYGSGQLDGVLGADDVRVGELVVQGQTLGLIAEESGTAFELLPLDGIVGLGFRGLTAHSTLPLFDNLVQQRLLPRNEFAFYLHQDRSAGGAVLWGGTDPRLYEGPVVWYPVVQEAYWALDFVSFRVGNSTFQVSASDEAPTGWGTGLRGQAHVPARRESGAAASSRRSGSGRLLIVDSGTTFFTATGEIYDAIAKAARPVPCKDLGGLPPLVYTVRDSEGLVQEIAVPPEEYMVKADAFKDLCVPGVVRDQLPGSSAMILGELFMRYHFTIFRRKSAAGGAEVGIARASHTAAALALVEEAHAGGPKVLSAAGMPQR